jgi:transcriptional regulator with XRE-family HTH domain
MPYHFDGARLRAAREAAGLTREEVASRIDRSVSTVTLTELNYRPPALETLGAMAAAVGVRVDDLFVLDLDNAEASS